MVRKIIITIRNLHVTGGGFANFDSQPPAQQGKVYSMGISKRN